MTFGCPRIDFGKAGNFVINSFNPNKRTPKKYFLHSKVSFSSLLYL